MAGIQSIDNFTVNSATSVTFGVTMYAGGDGTLTAGNYNFYCYVSGGSVWNWTINTTYSATNSLSFSGINLSGSNIDAYNFTGDYWVQQPNGNWYGSSSNNSVAFTYGNQTYSNNTDTYTPSFYPTITDQGLYDPTAGRVVRQANVCVPCATSNVLQIFKWNELGQTHRYHSLGWIFGNRSSLDTSGNAGMIVQYGMDKMVSDGAPLSNIFPEMAQCRYGGGYPDVYDYNDWTDSGGHNVIGARTLVTNNYSSKLSEAQRYRFGSYTRYSAALSNVDTIKNAIRSNGAVLLEIGAVANNLYNFMNSSDGILPRPNYPMQYSGHAMSIIGWTLINSKTFWVCNNNWGTSFGKNGLCYMPVDYTPILAYWVVTNNATPAPSPPVSGVTLSARGDWDQFGWGATLTIGWGANSSGVNYILARSISGQNSWTYTATSSMNNTNSGYGSIRNSGYALDHLAFGTSYDFKIASVDGDSTSQPMSSYTSINTATTLPRSPNGISSPSQSSSTIDVSATIAQDSYTGNFTAIRITNTTTGTYIDITTSGGTAHFTGLSSGTAYSFQAQTYYNVNGTTLWSSSTKTASYSTNQMPSTPSAGITLNTSQGSNGRGDGTLYLQWGTSTSATSYSVGYKLTTDNTYTYINTGNTATTYQLNGLQYGYTYDLIVAGVNSTGTSAYTTSNPATTLPQTPQTMNVSTVNTSISATPNLTSGQYTKITVTLKNGATTISSQDVSNGGTATFTGLSSGVTYTVIAQTYLNVNSTTLWSFGSLSQNVSTNARPANWQWTTACDANGHKISGNNFALLSTEWNNFTSRINSFRTYKGMSTVTFTQAVSGSNFTASMFNQALDDMVAIPTLGSGFIGAHVSVGDGILASRLNNVMDSLNAIT